MELDKAVASIYQTTNLLDKIVLTSNSPDLVISVNDDYTYTPDQMVYMQDISFPLQIDQNNWVDLRYDMNLASDEKALRFILNYIYRFPHFRPNQIDGIVQTLEHSDSIVLLPTGSGKSLVYQILSFILPGTTLIVDPIVSLIDDQVDNLNRMGIDRAIGITSATDNKDKVQQAITRGQYNMIFVSPERFQIDSFRQCLTSYCANAPIATCAIDEAHCVSEWGHDFRTSYLNLASTCRKLLKGNDGAPAILALTGTASESVLRDMERDLGISDDLVIRPESFDRKEIQFIVRPVTSADKPLALKQILLNDLPQRYKQGAETFYALNRSQTNCGIIFCPFIGGKFGVKSVLELVRGDGVMAKEYYGQQTERTRTMSDEEWQKTKALHARDFKDNNYPVLVATKSFGMGIDKPNIRFTIHYSLPQSVEEYYQEAGRAGRDHRQSYSYLIVSNDNHNNIQMLLDRNISASQLKEIEKRQSRQDDISRALYFHTQTFTGIDNEIQTAQKVLRMIDNFDKPHTEVIALPQNQDRTSFEKVIYRLSIFNIVRDYTINFANNEFTVDINRVDREAIAQSYGAYVGKYQGDVGFVESHVNDIRTIDEINDRDFIIAAIRILLQDFIYKTIEQSRRNSLANLLDAVTNFKPNSTDKERSQQMRQKILNFLGNTYVDVIRTTTDNPGNLRMIYKTIKSVKGASKRAKLSAEVSRALQSYPFHPGLLLASACLTINKHSTTSDIKRLFHPIINYGMTQYGLELRDIMEVIVTALNEASIEPSVYADSMVDLLNTFDRPQTEQILLDILPPKYHYIPIVYASSRITSNLITELRKDKL